MNSEKGYNHSRGGAGYSKHKEKEEFGEKIKLLRKAKKSHKTCLRKL